MLSFDFDLALILGPESHFSGVSSPSRFPYWSCCNVGTLGLEFLGLTLQDGGIHMSNICEYELILQKGCDFIEVGKKPSKSYVWAI